MTTRQFDPVFSAALRNELAALADTAQAPGRLRTPVLRRPQLWITVATALLLLAATLGVLRIVPQPPQPADHGRQVVDPLTRVTDPRSDFYVARSVDTLIDSRGVGSGTRSFSVPAGVTAMRVYLNCSGSAKYGVRIDHDGGSDGSTCSSDSGNWYGIPVTRGTHDVTVRVGTGVAYALLIIEEPAPTVSTGALIDPLTAVRDLRDPDALVGDTRPLLRIAGSGDGGGTATLPSGVRRVRVYLVCATASATTHAVVDGHLVSGCQNSIAHWFDLTPGSSALTASVEADPATAWSLLAVRAPAGATDSPADAVLPYPKAAGALLAEARGAGAQATGTYRRTGSSIRITTTCRGTGWLEIVTGDGGTTTRGSACSATRPSAIGFDGDTSTGTVLHWTVTPHGDISWTFQLSKDD